MREKFANAAGYSTAGAVNNWIKGENLPPSTKFPIIEHLLLGDDASRDDAQYAEWRSELREAYQNAQAHKGTSRKKDQAFQNEILSRKRIFGSIPVRVPYHFLGRESALAEIETALAPRSKQPSVVAVRGMRGIGKTTIAAAYASQQQETYSIIWWIRAEARTSILEDLLALGRRLSLSFEPKDKEDAAHVISFLGSYTGSSLLIFDNVLDATSVSPFIPPCGASHILITSNSHVWRAIATPIEIALWSEHVGAEYLIARTGRVDRQKAARSLSAQLGGLPLAHEQSAAYCEQLSVSFANYEAKLRALPEEVLDDASFAPKNYRDGTTVSKTFRLAIEEATRAHPAAQTLIHLISCLPSGSVPLCLFVLGIESFGQATSSLFGERGVLEAIAALRKYALVNSPPEAVDRFEAVQLHRLVRLIASKQLIDFGPTSAESKLVAALALAFSRCSYFYPKSRSEADDIVRLHSLLKRILADVEFQEKITPEDESQLRRIFNDHTLKFYTAASFDNR